MNRKDFYKAFAKEHDISQSEAKNICFAVFDFLGKTISEEDNLYIYGLGTFKHKKRAEKRVVHPITKEEVIVPERDVICFEQSAQSAGDNASDE